MASLEISLNDIPPEGLEHNSQVTRVDLDLTDSDPGFEGALDFAATIHASEDEAWVAGHLRGSLILECVRCLSDFQNFAEIPVEAYYRGQEPSTEKEKPKGRKEKGPEPNAEEVDSYLILNDQFNLAEMLRELLILSIPIQPLCQEQCQGLCHACGQNLNEQQCGCELLKPESPFAVLRDKLQFPKESQE